MYQDFQIVKQTGTYSETLEAFGVANLISNIFSHLNIQGVQIKIEDKGTHYSVTSNKPITDEMLGNLTSFLVLKFIKKDGNQEIPNGLLLNDYYNYPAQKAELDAYKKRFADIESNKQFNAEQKKQERKKLAEEKLSEFGGKLDAEFDVFREIIGKPYESFIKLFQNLHSHQEHFKILIFEILNFYSGKVSQKRNFKLIDEKPSGLQLYNPSQSKGLNKIKANNASMGPIKSFWIPETMKLSGALSVMVCQLVKVGGKYDLKIFVPEFNDILLHKAKDVIFKFKKNLKSTSPTKLDIINILDFSEKFIKETPEYNKGKVKNTIKGFHSVYQKDLGNARGVTNIAFIQTPDFIEYNTKEQSIEWIEILNQQKALISNIQELGDSIQGLQSYRSFLGSVNNTSLNHFSKFNYWYSGYLMQQLTKGNKFVRTFKIEHLNKFYNNMEPKLSEIINNEGFIAISSAIRNSTIRLQIKSQFQMTHEKFEIKYGFAQELQSKSRSKIDLAKFIANFLGKYNSETARHKEKKPEILFRPNVRKEDEDDFYTLLEKYSNNSDLIGALLASYGYALPKYEQTENSKLEKLQKEAEVLGYQLVKIEDNARDDNEQNQDNQEDNN